jgi:segregation and condensation protein B
MELTKIVEALLFSYQEPLSVEHMTRAVKETARDIFDTARDDEEAMAVAQLTKVGEEDVLRALHELIAHYDTDGHSFTIAERAGGWRLCAKAEFTEWSRALYPGKKSPRLSQPALETLAIIAYRQPMTKAGIEAVRGVAVDTMVQQLVDRGMVRVEGRAALPGKPLLYGTTDAFLDHFGIKSLDDLPNATELRRMKLPEAEEQQPPAAAVLQMSEPTVAAPMPTVQTELEMGDVESPSPIEVVDE